MAKIRALCLVLFSFQLIACAHKPPPCALRERAVIDMGSGTFKLVMGQVQVCGAESKITKLHLEGEERVVGLEASKNKDGEIPEHAQQDALAALTELRLKATAKAQELDIPSFEMAIVATHAIRTASNQDSLLRFWQTAGYKVQPISQLQEAWAGYLAAKAQAPATCANDALVWDVGGGSTQLVRATSVEPNVARFDLGAENFRKRVITTPTYQARPVRGCKRVQDSPNPLGQKQFDSARKLAAGLIPANAVTPSTCTIGIGGVHAKAILAHVKKNWMAIRGCACANQTSCIQPETTYTKKQVECLGKFFATKSDCAPEIQGPYSSTSVTNLAMVLGVMDKLNINEVHALSINMGHHFLTEQHLKFERVKTD